jgi:hypothetical protein
MSINKEFIKRFEKLRQDLFDAIDYNISQDGHHKSYEGRLSLVWPHRFNNEYCIELDCYVLGSGRHNYWVGDSFDICLDEAEKDIRRWIKEDREAWES